MFKKPKAYNSNTKLRVKKSNSKQDQKRGLWLSLIYNPVLLVIVIGALLLFFFLFKNIFIGFYNYIKNVFRSTGSKLTDEQAKLKSDRIWDAMETWNPLYLGTNVTEIQDQLKSTTKEDYYKISKFFGTKTYAVGGSFLFGQDLDLTGWLVAELNDNNINQISQTTPYIKQVLGITSSNS